MATSAAQPIWLLAFASVCKTASADFLPHPVVALYVVLKRALESLSPPIRGLAKQEVNRQPTLAALERRDVRLDGLVGPLDRVEAARPLAPLLRRPRVEVMRPLVGM